jgi:fucose 4-O-acetylase-like acetyltransferase
MNGDDHTSASAHERLAFADAVRAVAVFLVVANHALSYVPSRAGDVGWLVFIIRELPVPIFFLCDGFLFFLLKSSGGAFDHRTYLKRSAQRLLIPWAFFSVLYTAVRAVFECFGMFEHKVVLGHGLGEILGGMYASQVASQMYFLPALFILRALTPLWRKLWMTRPAAHLLIYIIYTAAFRLIEPRLRAYAVPGYDPILHALSGMQFYLAGTFIARVFQSFSKNALPILGALALSIPILRFATGGELEKTLTQHVSLFAAFAFFLLITVKENRISRIGKDTMGIYLLNGPPLIKVVSIVFSGLLPWPAAAFILTTAATYFLSLYAARLLRSHPYGKAVMGEFPIRSAPDEFPPGTR